jgi:hypothetical protein
MTKLFSGEIMIAATVYVVADSEEEARKAIEDLHGNGIEFSDRRQMIGEDLWMTGESFNADMPAVSLSPAMTIQDSPTRPSVWLCEEDLGEEEEEA